MIINVLWFFKFYNFLEFGSYQRVTNRTTFYIFKKLYTFCTFLNKFYKKRCLLKNNIYIC